MSERLTQSREDIQLAENEQWVDFVPPVAVPYVKQRNAAENRADHLEKEAVTDELTGLLNQRGLMQKLNLILSDPNFDPNRYVLLYFDLNGFKAVNDKYTHDEGDKVLKHVANRFERRKTDVAARLHGDEFVVLVDTEAEVPDRRGEHREDHNPRRAPKTREEVIKGLTDHLVEEVHQGGLDAGYAGISASVGVQEFNGERDSTAIINKADQAMQAHKTITKAGR